MSESTDQILKNELALRNQIRDKQYELDDSHKDVISFANSLGVKYNMDPKEISDLVQMSEECGKLWQQLIVLLEKDVPSVMIVGDDIEKTMLNELLDSIAAKEQHNLGEYSGIIL